MKDLTVLTDDQLYEEYKRLMIQQMYYMAAEGNWSAETEDRKANEKEYYACMKELDDRGLEYTK
jgi:hypothetical protein